MAIRGVRFNKANTWIRERLIHPLVERGGQNKASKLDELGGLPTRDNTYTQPVAFALTDRLRVVFGQLRISMHPPNPHVRIPKRSCRRVPITGGHRLKRLCVDDLRATQRIRATVRWRRLRRDNDLYCLACMERKIFEMRSVAFFSEMQFTLGA